MSHSRLQFNLKCPNYQMPVSNSEKPKNSILALVSKGESEELEFKSDFGKEALESICAFANSAGGKLLIGIADNKEVKGVLVGKKTLEDWVERIKREISPAVQFSLTIDPHVTDVGNKIVVLTVQPSPSASVSYKGKFFKRVGRANQTMTGDDIAHRIISATNLSWDIGVEENASLKDLDEKAIAAFIDLLNKHNRRPVSQTSSAKAVLEKLELVKNGKPTRAAVLLFAEQPKKFYPTAFIKMGRFKSATLIVDDFEADGNLLNQLVESENWFRRVLQTELKVTGAAGRETVWEYPSPAIREAIANAICHRDYLSEASVQVRLYDDHLEFWNPGSLSPLLTIEDLSQEHESVQRNPKIAEMFFLCGFIERWGTGTLRMIQSLKESGYPAPEFLSVSQVRFRVRFRKQLTHENLRERGLNKRQIDAINYLKQHQIITSAIYCDILNASPRTATRELAQLVSINLITRHGKTGKGTYYVLN